MVQKIIPPLRQFFTIPHAEPNWFRDSVLFPFILTRAIWQLVAYFAYGNYVPNPSYPRYIEQGYFLTRYFPLDVFARWDARWYMSIITDGYQASANLTQSYSNMAFFPLYPYLVKSLGWFGLELPNAYYILVGLLLSNALFVAAMALLYRLVIVELGHTQETARRTLGLIFAFPAAFYFASFYTESLFLFLAVAGFTFAMRDKWWQAGLAAALAVLTRSTGVALVAALAWLYMEKIGWKWRELRPTALWLGLAPAALLAHFFQLYLISGRPFAIFEAMSAWGRISVYNVSDPFRNLVNPWLDVFKIDLVLAVLFVVCSAYIFWKWPIKSYGLFALLMCGLPLYTGLLVSFSRYMAVVFPVFILLGDKLTNRNAYDGVRAVWFALQIVYFAGWVNYYWIA